MTEETFLQRGTRRVNEHLEKDVAFYFTDAQIKATIEAIVWEMVGSELRKLIREELEIFFMRRDPLFQKILHEVTVEKK